MHEYEKPKRSPSEPIISDSLTMPVIQFQKIVKLKHPSKNMLYALKRLNDYEDNSIAFPSFIDDNTTRKPLL